MRRLSNLLSVCVLALSAGTLAGWFCQISGLVQPFPEYAPMQPNTALCFFLLGGCVLVGNCLRLRSALAIMSAAIILLSAATLSQYVFQTDLGIDTLLANPFICVQTSSPGRMAPTTAIGLALLGLALMNAVGRSSDSEVTLPTFVLSLTSGSLGLITLTGYALGIEVTYGWSDYTRMSPLAGLCFCISSAAVLTMTLRAADLQVSRRAVWAAIGAGLVGQAGTLAFWVSISQIESSKIQLSLALDLKTRAHLVQEALESKISELKSIARFFEASEGEPTQERLEAFAGSLVGRRNGVVAIDWAVREGRSGQTFPVRLSVGSPSTSSALGFDHFSSPATRAAMDRAVATGQAIITEPMKLDRLEPERLPGDFFVVLPAFDREAHGSSPGAGRERNDPRGFVVGVFRASWLISYALKGLPDSGIFYSLTDGKTGETLFHSGALEPESPNVFETTKSGDRVSDRIAIGGRTWRLNSFPTDRYIGQMGSWFPLLVLILGIGISVGASAYILTLQRRNAFVEALVRDRTREIRELNENLESRVIEKTAEVNEANRFLESVMDNTSTLIHLYDLERQANVYVNRYCEDFRVTMDSAAPEAGYGILQFSIHPEDRNRAISSYRRLWNAGRNDVVQFEVRARNAAGEWRWLSYRATVFHRSQEGVARQILAAAQDITAIKNAEAAVARSEAEFRGAFQNAAIGMALISTTGSFLRVNEALCRMTGYREAELLELSCERLIDKGDRAAYQACIERLLDGVLETEQLEYRFVHQSGRTIWVLSGISLVRDRRGRPLHFVSQLKDITAKKDAERELNERNHQLALTTQFKSQFLANMSHEMRTPLASIIGYSDSILRGELSGEEQQDALQTVLRNGKHLLGVINDILDLSKIEAGNFEVDLAETSVRQVIADIEGPHRQKAIEQGVAFGVEWFFPVPQTIRTDSTRLRKVLLNLVGNALKFTKTGGVKLGISFDPEQELMSFAVTDTGIGIRPEELANLFQPFSQGDSTSTRKFGGTGLGLVISQELARRLGGEITMESVYGVGTRVTLTIATGNVPPENLLSELQRTEVPDLREVATPLPSENLSGKVLLVEDGPDNQQYISFLLKKLGLDFVLAENGEAALKSCSKESFDLVLMDMQMPVMDGYTATRKLRQGGFETPIVALTANTMKQDVQRILDAGCNDVMGKPFDRGSFVSMLAKHLRPGMVKPLSSVTESSVMNDIRNAFVAGLEQQMNELRTAWRSGDRNTIASLAHKLRGASMFGFAELADAAGVIEDELRLVPDALSEALLEPLLKLAFDLIAVYSLRRESGESAAPLQT